MHDSSSGYRSSAAPRVSFDATSAVRRRTGVAAVLGINLSVVVIGLGCALLRTLVPERAAVVFAIVAFLVAAALFYWVLLRTRAVSLEVEGDRVFVDGGLGGAFSLSSGRVGPWRAATGIVCGSALVLSDGERVYRIGGVEHRAVVASHREGPTVDDVEVSLPAEAFAALLARLGAPDQIAQEGSARSLRCHLAPNPSAPRVVAGNVLPWFATIIALGLMSAGFGATGLFELEVGRYVAFSLMGLVLVGGFALTIVRSMRRNTGLDVSLDEHSLQIHDARTGRALAAVPYASVGRERAVWKVRMRGFTADYPVMVLVVPGYGELSICVQDTGVLSEAPGVAASTPRFLVGAIDWAALAQRLPVR